MYEVYAWARRQIYTPPPQSSALVGGFLGLESWLAQKFDGASTVPFLSVCLHYETTSMRNFVQYFFVACEVAFVSSTTTTYFMLSMAKR